MIEIRITVLVDNRSDDARLIAEHGLALHVQVGGRFLLFDTGQTGAALRHNAGILGIDLAAIEAVALSHGHYDHTGGLADVLAAIPRARLYMHPDAARPKYRRLARAPHKSIGMPPDTLKAAGDSWIGTSTATEIMEGVFVTGIIPRSRGFESSTEGFCADAECLTPDPLADDQALWINTRKGPIVALGCAHAGVVNTLDHIRALTGSPTIRAVIGGMHLRQAGQDRLRATADALRECGVEDVAACHCTGEEATAGLTKSLGSRCRPCCAGRAFAWEK